MKTLSFLLLLFISSLSLGQNAQQINYLVGYGQVWGFLKYFHPAPSETNWDQRLINDFEKVKNCPNDAAFNVLVADLLADCGDYAKTERKIADSLRYAESFEWLKSPLFSDENRAVLHQNLALKPSFKNRYILENGAGHPKIINESEYSFESYQPEVNYLALTRYWNIINYYCPNRNLIPENWTKVYTKYIPVFHGAESYTDYYFAVRQLTAEIRDGHGFIRSKEDPMDTYKFLPFYFEHVSEGYFITIVWQDSLSPFNLQKMDRIVALDGIPIEERVQKLASIISTSNDYFLSKSTYYLRIFPIDSVSVTVERNGELLHMTVPTIDRVTRKEKYKPTTSQVKPSPYDFLRDSISGKDYAYIDLAVLERKDINGKFKRALYKTDQIIIDNRNYPNWTVIKLSKILIHGKTKFAKFRKINFDYPGTFEWTESQTIGGKGKGYQGKIYVLVDYRTMSQGEYTVMGFQQHPNTVVIGGQTAGADGNISTIPLPYSIASVFSGLAVYYLDGTCAQQVGVKRDIDVVQDIRRLTEKRDAILEKALELIRK